LANRETLYAVFGRCTARVFQYLNNYGPQVVANYPELGSVPMSARIERPMAKKLDILGTVWGIFGKGSSKKDDPKDVWNVPADEATEDMTWDICSFTEDMPSAEVQKELIPKPTFSVPASQEVVSREQDDAASSEAYVPISSAAKTEKTAESLEAETAEPADKSLAAFVEETVAEAEEKSESILYANAARPEEKPAVNAEQEQCPAEVDESSWDLNDNRREEQSKESLRENPDELANESAGGSYLAAEVPEPKPCPTNSFFQARKPVPPEKNNMLYMPHQMIAVWSPDGLFKSFTAVNLAALAAFKGFDTALINYDLLCPELDIWFGVKQTGLTDRGCDDQNNMGVMTFEGFRPELMLRFLKMRAYGIQYLPAGNKLGNIGTPQGVPLEPLEQTLKVIYNRNTKGKPAITIVDAGRPFEDAPTLAALRQAAIVLIPTDGSPASAAIARQQIEELRRLGYNPRFIEVLFATPGIKAVHVCQERCSMAFDWNTYLVDRTAMKPQCLRVDGRRAWEVLLNQLAASSGNVFRRL
jgi:Mrp family chromosome partitioning ATPase